MTGTRVLARVQGLSTRFLPFRLKTTVLGTSILFVVWGVCSFCNLSGCNTWLEPQLRIFKQLLCVWRRCRQALDPRRRCRKQPVHVPAGTNCDSMRTFSKNVMVPLLISVLLAATLLPAASADESINSSLWHRMQEWSVCSRQHHCCMRFCFG